MWKTVDGTNVEMRDAMDGNRFTPEDAGGRLEANLTSDVDIILKIVRVVLGRAKFDPLLGTPERRGKGQNAIAVKLEDRDGWTDGLGV